MATFNSMGKMVSIRMIPEIYHSLNLEISDINSALSERFQDKNVSKEVVINAVLIYYLSRSKEKRRPALRTCLRALERIMESPETDTGDPGRIYLPKHLELPENDDE